MFVKEGVLKVVWNDGSYKWYRVSGRRLPSLSDYFFNIANFSYAKLYLFDRKTRITGRQICAFGYNQKTRERYIKTY